MIEPTKAAMKAAKAIFGSDAGYGGCNKRDAKVIDRETGLPELVAALKELREICRDAGRHGALCIADNALRKAGEL